MGYRVVATLAVGVFAASALVGWSWHHRSSRSADHTIAPDRDTHAAVPSGPEEPATPGIANARENGSYRPRQQGMPQPLPPTTLRLDTIEPWTGEDLQPQLELAAAARARIRVDRRDPWDPAMIHPVTPARDLRLDSDDPWASNTIENGVANATPDPEPTEPRL